MASRIFFNLRRVFRRLPPRTAPFAFAASLTCITLFTYQHQHRSRYIPFFRHLNCDAHTRTLKRSKFGWTELHSACANQDVALVKQILSDPSIDVNEPDSFTYRMRGTLDEVADAIMNRRRAFDTLDYSVMTQGATALHYAVYGVNTERVFDGREIRRSSRC